MKNLFIATTLPGISPIAKNYLNKRFGRELKIKEIHRLRNNDLIVFSFAGDTDGLFDHSMVEDIFEIKAISKLEGSRLDLKELKTLASKLNLSNKYRKAKGSKSHTARVVVQAADQYWRKYRRTDIQKNLELGLYRKYKVVKEDANYELWAQQVGRDLIISTRLSDRTMRHREYKVENFSGALRPTIANAMVYLSKPEDDDIFLDPMCGSGTILIERAIWQRYELLIGMDKSTNAIETTLLNFGKKHKPRRIELGDVTNLKIDNESVTKVVTNPPWGIQMKKELEFYSEMLEEINRVLVNNGKCVLILKRSLINKKALADFGFRVDDVYNNISILGADAEILVITKTNNL